MKTTPAENFNVKPSLLTKKRCSDSYMEHSLQGIQNLILTLM